MSHPSHPDFTVREGFGFFEVSAADGGPVLDKTKDEGRAHDLAIQRQRAASAVLRPNQLFDRDAHRRAYDPR